ncbi:MAG: PKD domain-containing protein, partial [Candidatus Pacearchaeota archaeon]
KKPSGDPLKLCANRDIEFKHNSYDADDLLRISWDFGDGNVTIAAENYSRALTPNLGNINHSYSETNLYIIILNVSEMNRNQYDLDNVSIQIFKEGINIFPIITQPKGVINTYVVTFNASQSYILNCSPYLTLYNFTTDDNCLKCLYVLSPGSTSPLYGKVYFRWSISEDNLVWSPLVSPLDDPSYNHSLGILLSPQNYTRYGGIVFSKLFVEPKRRYAKFEMRFE